MFVAGVLVVQQTGVGFRQGIAGVLQRGTRVHSEERAFKGNELPDALGLFQDVLLLHLDLAFLSHHILIHIIDGHHRHIGA